MMPENGPFDAVGRIVQQSLSAHAEARRTVEALQAQMRPSLVAMQVAQRAVDSMSQAMRPSLVAIETAQRAAASVNLAMQQAAQMSRLIQMPAIHYLPPVLNQRDQRIRQLEAKVHDLEARVGRRLAVVEGEVAMVWAVVDWANEGEPPEDDAEAPRDQEPD